MNTTDNASHGLVRALSLIDFLSHYPRGLALAEIARETNMPKSTVHRLLKLLSESGYIRTNEGVYSLSFKVCELSNRLLSGLDILEIAVPIIKRLCSRTQEIVHLVVPNDVDIVYLRKEDPIDHTMRSMSYTGMRRPMYLTAAGKSILSCYSDKEVKDIWKRSEIVKITDNTIMSLSDLTEELRIARQVGYAIDNEENEIGIKCIGAVIRNHMEQPVGAISISAPANRMTPDRISELGMLLIAATNSVSFSMGYCHRR